MYPFAFQAKNYNQNMATQEILPWVQIRYQVSGVGTYDPNSYSWKHNNNTLSVTLEKFNNKTKSHEYLSQYLKSTVWEVHNENFNHTFKLSSAQTQTDATINSKVNNYKSTATYYIGVANGGGANGWMSYNVQCGNTKCPTVGLMGNYSANNIYQFKDDFTVNFGNSFEVKKLKLHEGVQIFAGKKDEKIEWTAKFSGVSCFNGTNTTSDSLKNQVEIYLSKSPFSDDITPTGGASDYIKEDGSSENYWLTIGEDGVEKTKKIKFTLEQDGIVYMKARPHYDASDSTRNTNLAKFWDLTLAIDDENGNFKLERQS